jgi:monoamine oxidase
MNDVKQDITINEFMNKYFSDSKYAPLRDSIIRFAEGFDLADTNKASVLSLREEWSHEFEEDQYRITGGYSLLAEYLADCCKRNKVQFYFSSEVSEISWSPHKVVVHTLNGTIEGNKLLITVSAGIVQSGKLRFKPEPTETLAAFNDIGYGTVMKFLLEFREPFWIDFLVNAGFVLSDEPVPTWWTQSGDSKLLTGWLGGPSVTQRTSMSDIELIDLALQSLSAIFPGFCKQAEGNAGCRQN